MTVRIGLALGRETVRAIAVRGNKLIWAGEAPLEDDGDLEATIETVLAEAPVSHLRRPVLFAAVGPHASQVKTVGGLPDAETLAAVVREGVASFFLKNGVPMITTGVIPKDPGTALAAALDAPCVEAVRNACRVRRWRMGSIAPAAVALPLALENHAFTWIDGDVALDITRGNGPLDAVRRRAACAAESTKQPLTPVPPLADLGEQAVAYAAAYGATRLAPDEALALGADRWRAPALRSAVLPGLVLVLATTSLLLSPLATSWSAQRAGARLRGVASDQWEAVVSALAQLDRVTAALDDVRSFADERSSLSILLADLTAAMPDGSVLLGFESDGPNGQLDLLAPPEATVLPIVQQLPGVAAAELIGPVNRETVAGRVFQRVTVGFRIEPAVRLRPDSGPAP